MSGVLHGVIASLKTAVAAVTDAYFKYVSLLLNTTSTNGAQNNTFLDGSANAFSITRNGNTTQGTFSPFSQTGWSNYFDGAGDYLAMPSNAAFNLSNGEFTIEFWIKPSVVQDAALYRSQIANVASNAQGVGLGSAGSINFFGYNGSTLVVNINSATGAVVVGEWTHVAISRSGNTTQIYINGVASGTPSTTNYTIGNIPQGPYIGIYQTGSPSYPFNGYISNFRFVKGTAVYTGNFTPPTAPLTAISGTSLLTCQSNRFIDNSTNNFTITRNGDVRVEAFSPFNPTAAWDAGTNGGSGYFDGAGDYLSLGGQSAFAFGTNDFTVEMWIYPLATGAQSLYGSTPATTDGAYLTFALNASNNLTVYVSAATRITGSVVASVGQWTHVAICRSGTSTKLFVNGTQDGVTWTDTTSYLNGLNRPVIGTNSYTTTIQNFNGYISDARVVKGTAVYTANFTPPTAPLTAIANTSLLLNFTNAGIYDSAAGNDLETVGNAQVSTTQAKWGTTSTAFDGTGDWLTAIDKPALRFGTGAFTIEGWLYLGATGAARGVVGKGTSTTGWLLSTDASDKVVFTYGTSTIVSTGALSGSTWYHIAVVREGTGTNQTKIYINGTNDGTGTVGTDFNQTSIMYVGANRTAGDALNGYIDDLRITNGYARYTGNFTPPTAAFPLN